MPEVASIGSGANNGQAPIRVAVLGNSNCVGNGSFTPYLAETPGFAVDNFAIGGSSGTCGLYTLGTIACAHYDFVIVDFAINDQNMLLNRGVDPEQVRTTLRTILHDIRGAGVVPLVLHFPVEASLDGPSAASALHHAICAEEDVHSLDFGEAVRHVLGAQTVALGQALRDPVHLTIPLAKLLASVLARAVRALHAAPRVARLHEALVIGSRSLTAATTDFGLEKVERSSRLRRATLMRFGVDTPIQLAVGADERLAGVLLSMGGLGANVLFEAGETQLVKNLNIRLRKERNPTFISMLADILTPLRGGENGVSLRIAPIERKVDEDTPNNYPAEPDAYGEVEIEGFVIWDRTPALSTRTVPTIPAVARDLMDLFGLEALADEVATAAATVTLESPTSAAAA